MSYFINFFIAAETHESCRISPFSPTENHKVSVCNMYEWLVVKLKTWKCVAHHFLSWSTNSPDTDIADQVHMSRTETLIILGDGSSTFHTFQHVVTWCVSAWTAAIA